MSIYNSLTRLSFSHLQCFALISCCSIFNDRAALLADSLTIISQHPPLVKTFWKVFLICKTRQKATIKLSLFVKNAKSNCISISKAPKNDLYIEITASFEAVILVGQQGLEPRTDRLWAGSSNQLSYWPSVATLILYRKQFILSIAFGKLFLKILFDLYFFSRQLFLDLIF